MIIEGVHLLPESVPSEFSSEAIIIQILICTCQEELHRNRFINRGQETTERSSQKYLENFESIRKIQDALITKAEENNIFLVDNVDFDDTVSKIIQVLTKRMGELVNLDFSEYKLPKKEDRL
jgi:2-phosphoglycerate kinase